MHHTFRKELQQIIYNPALRRFCKDNSAHTIFDNILGSLTNSRQSISKRRSQEFQTVEIMYKMCYCKSQKCNYMQKDHGIYFKFSHLTKDGIDTEFNLWNSVCNKTLSSEISRLSNDINNIT